MEKMQTITESDEQSLSTEYQQQVSAETAKFDDHEVYVPKNSEVLETSTKDITELREDWDVSADGDLSAEEDSSVYREVILTSPELSTMANETLELSEMSNETLDMIRETLDDTSATIKENPETRSSDHPISVDPVPNDNVQIGGNDIASQSSQLSESNTKPDKRESEDIGKEQTVLEDIHNKHFTLSINLKKRTGKTTQLKEEEFDNDIYLRNTTGFVTTNPVRWSMAMERYIQQQTSTRCRWTYKKEPSGVYSEAHLLLYFDTTKKIEVKINYTNGVLMVQGEPYKNWVTKEFPRVKNHFDEISDCPEEKVETASRKSSLPNANSRDIAGLATLVDVDMVWEKIDELVLAVKNQDAVFQGLIERCQGIEIKVSENKTSIDTKLPKDLLEIEKKIDERCGVFMETTTKDSSKAVTDLKTSVSSQLASLKVKIGEIERKMDTAPEITPRDVDLDKIVAEKVNAINIPSKIQTELDNADFIESSDPKFRMMESDINNLKTSSSLEERKLTNFDLRLKTFASHLDGLIKNKDLRYQPPHTSTIPPSLPSASSNRNVGPPVSSIPSVPLVQSVPLVPTAPPASLMSVSPFPSSYILQDLASGRTSLPPAARDTGATFFTPPQNALPTHVTNKRSNAVSKDTLELFMCFDSNGKHIDRKKLWKKNDSDYKQCGTLRKVWEEVQKLQCKVLKYMVISVGTNDLDEKDHDQVLGELELLLNDIRARFPGVKFIINELLPRLDERNDEVGRFNTGLQNLKNNQPDITVASQQNMVDPAFYRDAKHLHESKVPIYAKNIIIAMLKAYGIRDKRELFVVSQQSNNTQHQPRSLLQTPGTPGIQDRFKKLANYEGTYRTPTQQGNTNINNETVIRDAIMQFGDILVKCIQR